MKDNITKRVALAGMLTALAMIFSYIEAIMPFSIGIYGVKLGLANLVVLSGLYYLPHRDVFLVSVTRIFLSTLLFGNIMALAYSLAGGILSFLVMSGLQKKDIMSMAGVSTAGGICHNIGQVIAEQRSIFIPSGADDIRNRSRTGNRTGSGKNHAGSHKRKIVSVMRKTAYNIKEEICLNRLQEQESKQKK